MPRAIVIVMDSFGIGASHDADRFGDEGANTLLSIAKACAEGKCEQSRHGRLHMPNLQKMGLGHACDISCGEFPPFKDSIEFESGAYGYAEEISSGKDTPSGHWEMMGAPVLFDWGYFLDKTNSFPPALIEAFIEKTGVPGILGNSHASGTEIIERLGEEHIQSRKPICYTSADSVFQIACHEAVYSPEELYRLCEIARELVDEYNIGRVIARPFVGDVASGFARTHNRRDYAVPPCMPTLLDNLTDNDGEVISVGKIADIYAHRGITHKVKGKDLDDLMDKTLDVMEWAKDKSLIFTNIVDFDTLYGHRRDVSGYAAALEAFDRRLLDVQNAMQSDDVLILSADHGCDPTFPGTEHTREHVPVLVWGHQVKSGSIGCRKSFADIGQSLARYFGLSDMQYGVSFF